MVTPRGCRRLVAGVSSLLVVAGLAAAPAVHAAPPTCGITAAIGVPSETVAGHASAGAVEVRLADCAGRSSQNLRLTGPHAGDRFGAAVTAVYLDNDGYQDLLIGIPGYDVGSATDAGAVVLFLGSATGLHESRILVEGSGGVPGTPQAGAGYGSALWSYREYDSGYRRVVVGEPRRDVGGAKDAGAYATLVFTYATLDPARSSEDTLNSPGIPGTAATGDLLGTAVWNDEIGAPGRAVAGHAGAGAVLIDDAGPAVLVTQNTPCMPGSAEAGDHFGAALSGLWIGVPDESLGSARDAGMVERYAPPNHCFALNQAVQGVAGVPETGDRFGAALYEVHGEEDDYDYYPEALLIGVPGEDTGSHRNSGFVDVESESFDPDDFGDGTIKGAGSTAGPNATNAAFGSSFGAGVYGGPALIGAPGVNQVYGENYAGATHGLKHTATYRPLTAVRQGTYGLVLGEPDL